MVAITPDPGAFMFLAPVQASRFSLNCTVASFPPAIVEWFAPDGSLLSGSSEDGVSVSSRFDSGKAWLCYNVLLLPHLNVEGQSVGGQIIGRVTGGKA